MTEGLPDAAPPAPVLDVPTAPLVLVLVLVLVFVFEAPSALPPPTPLPEAAPAPVPPEVDAVPLPPLPASEDSADPPHAHWLPVSTRTNDAKIRFLCQLCHSSDPQLAETPRICHMSSLRVQLPCHGGLDDPQQPAGVRAVGDYGVARANDLIRYGPRLSQRRTPRVEGVSSRRGGGRHGHRR